MPQRTSKHKIQYWTYGDAKKSPLLFVHGFTGSHEGFQYIVPLLEDYYVITPDLPGFGVSPRDTSIRTVEALAEKTNEFVRELALEEKPVLVSHSLGGLVAASMLDQAPELFAEKTIFISPVATKINWLDSRKIGALLANAQYAIGAKTGKFGERFVRNKLLSRVATIAIMTEKNPTMRKTIFQHHFDNLDHISSIEYYHDLYKDIISRGAIDYIESLQKFDVQIIAGNKDNVTPLNGEVLLATSINARLDVIPDVGHLAHYEKPAEIVSLLRDFLE